MTDSAGARSLVNETFDEWPDAARALFDGSSLASKTGLTASLMTVDANEHVRTSLLGVGELYAPDSRTLCVALWPGSRAAGVLSKSGRGALTFVCEDAFYQVQLRFEPLPAIATQQSALLYFSGLIDTGETQRVGYARLTSGITFELGEGSETVLERWEQQIEHLKQAAALARRG
ncbi:hypothetical protein [Paraburkholderia sp. DHOC27]|uniref:hypothetical protein n=1 Tax=Paraburkholderia sp. DHOC27 TaxID=2303330 RepID=UPI000E3C0A3E|nr:hypothetical protein [Paraburkholderia sp. DHOC27]RFU46963.1 hypothetical protein D0B32_12375 [Paraburkholderia sp. DHOC27]